MRKTPPKPGIFIVVMMQGWQLGAGQRDYSALGDSMAAIQRREGEKLQHRDGFDFDLQTRYRQFRDTNGRRGGIRFRQEFAADFSKDWQIPGQIGEVRAQHHDVLDRRAACLEDFADALECLPNLSLHVRVEVAWT